MTFNLLTDNSNTENTMHGNGGIGDKRALEREALRNVIAQWNANRLDLFELSEPNENLEFHGVMRFYFQDSSTGRAATKCVRVASDATAEDVVATLVEKFRPDMRMLTPAGSVAGQYALYEVHGQGGSGGGAARKLEPGEKPLLVQLNWHIDDRDGRFLLRNVDDEHHVPAINLSDSNSSFRRKLSKREKKQLKKQEKLARMKSEGGVDDIHENSNNVAEKLYSELPETSFTRSISNPEAVMRRRRQQKLEKKLQQFRSKDGGPDTGGTLKIYGEALCADVPYKTLLLSVRDCAAWVVREMLNKYGLEGNEDSSHWCLVQTTHPPSGSNIETQEYVLDDDECPLAILMNHPSSSGSIMFHVRRRPADCAPRKRKKKPGGGPVGPGGQSAPVSSSSQYHHHRGSTISGGADHHGIGHRGADLEQCPMLVELGADQNVDSTRTVRLTGGVMEVGSANGIALQLYGPHIQPHHCLINYNIDSGVTTLTPCHVDAHTYVNEQRIHQSTILQHGTVVKFGRVNSYRFLDPAHEGRSRIHSTLDNTSVYDRSPTRPSQEQNHLHITSTRERALSPTNFSMDTRDARDHIGAHSHSQSQMLPLPQVAPSALQPYDSSNQLNARIGNNCNGHMNVGNNNSNIIGNSVGSMLRVGGQQPPTQSQLQHKDNYETTFDLDGNVETVSTNSVKNEDTKSINSDNRYARGQDSTILPAVLEFPEDQQEHCLARVITSIDPTTQPSFKLAPAYTLYLCARYRASTHYRPELQPTERAHKLTLLLQHVASLIHSAIQERYNDSTSQAFWLANSSELLNFLKSDRHICAFSLSSQETLAESVQLAFSYLTSCITTDLNPSINALLSENNDLNSVNPTITNLSSAMSLLRHCRVNAALTIQLFSQLFHYISARSLNVILSTQSICCKKWGLRLTNRLTHISRWAESQGLELAAECHLAKIQQCAHLLQAPKQTAEDIANLPSACFKLNSVQLGTLLKQYQCEEGEAPLAPALVAQAVCVAQTLADELALADGREVRLLEQQTLPLALLLPEDGYSCDVVRGVPPGLAEFLRPLQPPCRLASQPTSAGSWTVYMHQHAHPLRSPSAMSNRSGTQQPEIQIIKLHKSTSGMGLSIVAAKGAGQERLGIYIKSVVPGGAADTDGRLQAGDQLLRVDGQSLIGITQERAAEYLVRTGPIVTLEVAKQGAIYHGLATLLQQPSPPMSRAGPRRMSERDIPSRFTDTHGSGAERSTIAASKSVPALHQVGASEGPQIPQRGPANQTISGPSGSNMSQSHHDVFNPGYSRTSSSNSINTPSSAAANSNNAGPLSPNIGTTATSGNTIVMSSKSKSVHNLVSPGGQDQGFYQNLSVYRNKAPDPVQLGDRTSTLRSSQNSLHSNNPLSPSNNNHQSTMNQRPASAYYSNNSIPNQQYQNRQNPSLLPPHHHQSIPNLKSSQSHSQLVGQQNYGRPSHVPEQIMSQHPNLKASQSHSALINNNQYSQNELIGGNNLQTKQHSSLSALARGQAKIAEMSEEIRRRQNRGMLSPQHNQHLQNGNYGVPHNSSGGIYGSGTPNPLNHSHPQTATYSQQQIYNQQHPSGYSPQHKDYGRQSQWTSQNYSPHNLSLNLSHINSPLSPTRENYNHHILTPQNSDPYRQVNNQHYTNNMGRMEYPQNQHHTQINQNYGTTNLNSVTHQGYIQGHMQQGQGQQQYFNSDRIYNKAPLSPPAVKSNESMPITAAETSKKILEDDPPPIPPSSTHPLYTASLTEPPRGAFYPTQQQSSTKSGVPTTNPWEREEREREAEVRREAARQWRDQQIAELGALPSRTPQQEEQLRALKLERDFQRRAQEAATTLDDEESTVSAPYSPQSVSSTMVSSITPVSYVSTRSQQVPNSNVSQNTNNEQSVTQHAPHTPTSVSSTNAIITTAAATPTSILKSSSGPNSPSKREGNVINNNNNNVITPTNIVNNLSNSISMLTLSNSTENSAPLPPERGSSYMVMSLRTGSNTIKSETSTTKRVSFNDNNVAPGTASSPSNQPLLQSNVEQTENVKEDPNQFFSQAESMLASPTTPTDTLIAGTTPGVIGAQEVYRDPRTRRLAEQAKQLNDRPIPEKLSFKEKMKMFAMETGEQGTPKDRSKISKAQREIDNLDTPGSSSSSQGMVH